MRLVSKFSRVSKREHSFSIMLSIELNSSLILMLSGDDSRKHMLLSMIKEEFSICAATSQRRVPGGELGKIFSVIMHKKDMLFDKHNMCFILYPSIEVMV